MTLTLAGLHNRVIEISIYLMLKEKSILMDSNVTSGKSLAQSVQKRPVRISVCGSLDPRKDPPPSGAH